MTIRSFRLVVIYITWEVRDQLNSRCLVATLRLAYIPAFFSGLFKKTTHSPYVSNDFAHRPFEKNRGDFLGGFEAQ